MSPDVSLILRGDPAAADELLGRVTLASIEVAAEVAHAHGRWVMFVDAPGALGSHAVKALLLAAEEHEADVAVGGSSAAVQVFDGAALERALDEVEVSCALFRRDWLQSRPVLLDELESGQTRIATPFFHEHDSIVFIPQPMRQGRPPRAVDLSLARVHAGQVGRLAGAAYALARLLPLGRGVLFDVTGSRAVDSCLDHLRTQWRREHPRTRQSTVTPQSRDGWRHAWQLGRARWLVTNEQFISRLPKRSGQRQLVASSELPLLHTGRDDPDWILLDTSERRPSWSQMQRWDLVASPGAFGTHVLRISTGYVGAVAQGASVFADAMATALTEPDLRARLSLDAGQPLVLCAVRDSADVPDLALLAERFGSRVQLVLVSDDGGEVPDAPMRQVRSDIPAWCAAADLMITDWSSLTMEFGRLKRPIMALQPNRMDAVRRRGSYLDLAAWLPGPIVPDVHVLLLELENWLAGGNQAVPGFAQRAAAFAELSGGADGDACGRLWALMSELR